MTIVQLAQRLAGRYLNPAELNLLPADGQLALCDAINGTLAEFYALAPGVYRRGDLSFTLPAPVTIPSVPVTANSATLGASVFDASQRGCSVQLTGDANLNQVAGPDALFDTFLGVTGTAQATVYGDAALFGAGVFSSLIGEPRMTRADSSSEHLLIRDDNLRVRRSYSGGCRIGRPESYTIFPTTLPGGSGELFLFRVNPLPDVACSFRIQADFQPLQFALDDLTRAVDLPVPEHHCLPILLPMAAAALADHAGRYWRDGIKPPDDSLARKRLSLLPSDFGTPENLVGTPPGW